MRCHEVEEDLSEYIDGVLSHERAELVEQHLLECRKCRELCDSMREIAGYMAEMERVDPPADFIQSINARLGAMPSFSGSLRRMLSPVRVRLPLELAGVAAAVILIFYVAQFNLREKAADSPLPSVPAETGLRDAEEIKDTKTGSSTESLRKKDETAPPQADVKVSGSSGPRPDDLGEKGKVPEKQGFFVSGKEENTESGEEKIRGLEKDAVMAPALRSGIVRQPRRVDVESWRLRIDALGGKIIDIQPPGGVSSPDSASVPVIFNIEIPVKSHERFLQELDKIKGFEKISAEVTGAEGDFLKIRLVIEYPSDGGAVKPEVE